MSSERRFTGEHGLPMWASNLERRARAITVAMLRTYGRFCCAAGYGPLDLPTPTAQHIRAQRDHAWGLKIGGFRE